MKIWLEYRPERVVSPVPFWVYRPLGTDVWMHAEEHEPPMPRRTSGGEWPIYLVEHKGQRLLFASLEEIDHVIEILGNANLPTTKALAAQAGYPRYQHEHWLSKLSKVWKSWKVRKELVQKLIKFRVRQRSVDRP